MPGPSSSMRRGIVLWPLVCAVLVPAHAQRPRADYRWFRGLTIVPNQKPNGTPKPVSQAALDAATTVVRPWWLYADYREIEPKDRIDATWAQRYPAFRVVPELLVEPDGKPATAVRVCKEEA